MVKRTLSSTGAFDLRQTLQVAVLEALVASRRWAPGDLAFQGGTSLHLVRASLIGAVRVKVELWQTPASALRALDVKVAQVRLLAGPAAQAQAFVPSLSTKEIHADKVFALAARRYLKPRDVFDLHWLREREPDLVCTSQDLALRLATYPNETADTWTLKAKARLAQLPGRRDAIARDLARWLPSSWPLKAADVQTMISAAAHSLAGAIVAMQALVSGKRRSAADQSDDPS